jgi:hypothetical protein
MKRTVGTQNSTGLAGEKESITKLLTATSRMKLLWSVT